MINDIRQMAINYNVENMLWKQFKEGKIKGSIHLSIGQEAIDVAAVHTHPNAMVFGNHRSHGQFLARTKNIKSLFNQVYSGMSQHLYEKDKFLSYGIQASMTPIAFGVAKAFQLKQDNKRVLCFIGDGTLGQGVLYETLNMLNKEKLPITFVCINNNYSMSKTTSIPFLSCLCSAFGIEYLELSYCMPVDTMVSKIKNTTAINNNLPLFICANTKRLCGHSANDTEQYRPKEELTNKWRLQHDPLNISCSSSKEREQILIETVEYINECLK